MKSKGAGLFVRNSKYSILDFTCCKGKERARVATFMFPARRKA